MFIVVLRYQIPLEKTRRYIFLQKLTTQVYLENGCLEVEVYRDASDSQYWMEIYKFRDRQHYDEVISAVAKDERINPVSEEFNALFGLGEYRSEKNVYYKMI
ncbi:MAG: hypothetical protein ACUVV4_00190 [Candidatus Bathyarchaeia archaeon]